MRPAGSGSIHQPRLREDKEDEEEQDEDRYAEDDLRVHASRRPENPMARTAHGNQDDGEGERKEHPEERDDDRPAKTRGQQRHAPEHEIELHRRVPPRPSSAARNGFPSAAIPG